MDRPILKDTISATDTAGHGLIVLPVKHLTALHAQPPLHLFAHMEVVRLVVKFMDQQMHRDITSVMDHVINGKIAQPVKHTMQLPKPVFLLLFRVPFFVQIPPQMLYVLEQLYPVHGVLQQYLIQHRGVLKFS